jgi:phenylacetate-CoA ligase
MLVIRGVNLFPSQIEEQLLVSDNLIGHYQIEVTRAGRLDEVTVHVEARPEALDPSLLREEARQAEARIKHRVGLTATVVIEMPGTIERSVGKAKRVIDRRGKE